MTILAHAPLQPSADKIFLALGQTLYLCQLFEATMLELLATANELLEGTGDGRRYQSSIETLSRKTLGQLLNDFRKKADIRTDIDAQLDTGLKARNFVVHHFAAHLGDDIADASKVSAHQRTLYEKCSIVMAANDIGLSVLESLGRLHSDRCNKMLAELEDTKKALRELVAHSVQRH
ncbi:hypothetical protein A1507_05410 [Methylomonas koyamae]|uniref:Uncharacterized protein n=1 Tax=Methylomonas koyamae TaxID=702114 RepID=A0A177NRQ4_9GAMM|nr:hypothetical protein [Methylomonas koyamae]OAI20234.1 hypothetical protein A1507_05410 [Methylomonas koyamae]